MPRKVIRTIAALATGGGLLLVAAALAARTPPFTPVHLRALDVTEGSISSTGPGGALHTADSAMRAEVLDGGRHARSARIWFRYLGESTTTVPLGSGLVRRQIGLKLRSADPCNLLYVMWHAYPDDAIQVQVKRNPGQSTSAECGNRGYTTITTIPLSSGNGLDDHSPHRLQVETRRNANGALTMAILHDGSPLPKLHVSAALSTGLRGPIGVRSDNGDYVFRLSSRP